MDAELEALILALEAALEAQGSEQADSLRERFEALLQASCSKRGCRPAHWKPPCVPRICAGFAPRKNRPPCRPKLESDGKRKPRDRSQTFASDGGRIPPNEITRFQPLNRSSRREEAQISSSEFRWSLLTSAATRFKEMRMLRAIATTSLWRPPPGKSGEPAASREWPHTARAR